jgi:hypothetical protein
MLYPLSYEGVRRAGNPVGSAGLPLTECQL